MKATPYKLNVPGMTERINRMDAESQYFTVQNLIFNFNKKLVFAIDLLEISKKIKVDTNLILSDIKSSQNSAEIFIIGQKIEMMDRFGFLEKTKCFRMAICRQLENLYPNLLK
jgi:hypothetical protein